MIVEPVDQKYSISPIHHINKPSFTNHYVSYDLITLQCQILEIMLFEKMVICLRLAMLSRSILLTDYVKEHHSIRAY